MFKKTALLITMVSFMMLLVAGVVYAADDMQKQLDDIKGALPKFAIPMREVGDRFQNMYFAADWPITCRNI